MKISVLLADDSEIMRNAIVRLLQVVPDIQILGEASGFNQTIELATKLHPQVIVLDLHMDDESSVTPSLLKYGLMGSWVLAMSIWNDDVTKSFAKAIGAAALLEKTTLVTELIPAIRKCAGGQNLDELLSEIADDPVN